MNLDQLKIIFIIQNFISLIKLLFEVL